MYIDPITLNWILIAAASIAASMIGYSIGRKGNDAVIASTIQYLSDEGFIKSFENSDGELELIKIHDEVPNGSEKSTDEA